MATHDAKISIQTNGSILVSGGLEFITTTVIDPMPTLIIKIGYRE